MLCGGRASAVSVLNESRHNVNVVDLAREGQSLRLALSFDDNPVARDDKAVNGVPRQNLIAGV